MAAGLCCFLFAIIFGVLLLDYLRGGAGLQIFPAASFFVGPLLGFVQVVGLAFAALISFAFGAHLSAQGLVRRSE
jgi:hypothetical protein